VLEAPNGIVFILLPRKRVSTTAHTTSDRRLPPPAGTENGTICGNIGSCEHPARSHPPANSHGARNTVSFRVARDPGEALAGIEMYGKSGRK
jgi:hypothetical protein